MEEATLDNGIQEEYGMRLNAARKENRTPISKIKSKETVSKVGSVEAVFMIFFGVIIDISSFIPVIGWPVDAFGGGVIWLWQNRRGLDKNRPWFLKLAPLIGTGIGFIPIVPAHTITILFVIVANTALFQKTLQKFFPK